MNGNSIVKRLFSVRIALAAVFGLSWLTASQALAEVTPKAFFNWHNTSVGDAPSPWVNGSQEGGGTLSKLTCNGVTVDGCSIGGNFKISFANPRDANYSDGTYVGIDGQTYTSILSEIQASLGLQTPINDTIYRYGIANGANSNGILEIGSLDASKKYVVYAGFGHRNGNDNTSTTGFKLNIDGYAAGSLERLQYVVTTAGNNTTAATSYTDFSAGTDVRPDCTGLMIVRFVAKPTAENKFKFMLTGDRSGINFIGISTIEAAAKEIAVTGDTTTAAINTLGAGATNLKLMIPAGRKITFTEALVASELRIVCQGALTLEAASQPSAAELAKLNVSGVQGKVVRSWATLSYSFNFNPGYGQDTSGAIIPFSVWMQCANANGGPVDACDGLSAVSWSSATTFQYNSGTFMNGYLDDGGNRAHVTIANVPYAAYDLIIYCQADTEGKKISPVTVNGALYKADTDGTAIPASTATETWGATQNTTPTLGVNTIRLNNLTTKDIAIIGGANANNARGGLAAVQFLRHDEPSSCKATVAGETNWASINWTEGSCPPGGGYAVNATVAVGANSVITVDVATILAKLTLTGSADLTIDASAQSLAVTEFDFSGYTGVLTLKHTAFYPVTIPYGKTVSLQDIPNMRAITVASGGELRAPTALPAGSVLEPGAILGVIVPDATPANVKTITAAGDLSLAGVEIVVRGGGLPTTETTAVFDLVTAAGALSGVPTYRIEPAPAGGRPWMLTQTDKKVSLRQHTDGTVISIR